jgi:hypothetical protein
LQAGHRFQCFIEPAGFIDLNFYCGQQGTRVYITYPGNNTLESTISERAGSSPFNAGLSLGAGFSFPLSNYRLLLKADYKHGYADLSVNDYAIYNRYVRFVLGLSL